MTNPVPDHQHQLDYQHWFEPVAEHLGEAYLRYSFTKGTRQEVDHLVTVLDLRPGQRSRLRPNHDDQRRISPRFVLCSNRWSCRVG